MFTEVFSLLLTPINKFNPTYYNLYDLLTIELCVQQSIQTRNNH